MTKLQTAYFDEMNRTRFAAMTKIALAADGLARLEDALEADRIANRAAKKFFFLMDDDHQEHLAAVGAK